MKSFDDLTELIATTTLSKDWIKKTRAKPKKSGPCVYKR